MANDNKKFLDRIGVQYLWDKINEYFSQIGHRHETSDVNGLDEYMEENAKAIRDTEKVVEELSELPLYPSQEQLGKIYAYDGKLYRAKKLNSLTLDFSKIEPNEQGYVTREIFMDFINQNGMNIITSGICDSEDELILEHELEKIHDGILVDGSIYFESYRRLYCELWNLTWFINSISLTYQSNYNENDEETYSGIIEISTIDVNGNSYSYSEQTSESYLPEIEQHSVSFGVNGTYTESNYPAAFYFENTDEPYILKTLTLGISACNSREDYEEGIFHDFLVWEEVSEEEIPIEDVTPATEETRKRFYREIENNNIYVTDAEYSPGEGGFIIDIVHPKTGQAINDTDELRGYIDPSEVWVNGVNGIEQIYGDNRYWNNESGERVTITPIRVGSRNNGGSICLSTKTDVDLYFSPYISFNATTQEAVVEQDYTTIEVDDSDAGETNEYEVDIFDNINLLEKRWTIVHVPVSSEVYINTSRRCYLHKIVKKGEGEGDRYYWSQIAKIQDIEDKINALPEVARTGSYTDLFNKPCIGDVQTYDWPNDEDFPIIEEGPTDSCENRFKQLLRWNNSLYTAVQNDSGLTLDLRQYSRDYKTQGYCGNSLRNFIFQDRIDIASAAYEDYYVSGNSILIQNTKGRGMQLGSSGDYGNVLLAMREEGNNKRFLFNEAEIDLQSWNGPDSDIKDYTTDNANIYVEIGTTSFEEHEEERDVESDLVLFVDVGFGDTWSILRVVDGVILNLSSSELQEILDTSGNTLVINGTIHSIAHYQEYDNGDEYWCSVELDNYDNLDYDWAYDTWRKYHEGYHVSFRQMVTEYVQVLTPQKTENVWFKRYSDEYTEEWVSTQYYCNLEEALPSENYVSYFIYDNNTGDYAYDFIASLNVGDVIKIADIEMAVKEIDGNHEWVRFDYRDDYPTENLTVSIKQRVYINNPILKETVKLTGTNCDYLKIWTQYDEDPEQYGRRCIIKTIMFNNLKYEYDPNPTYNRDIYKKNYWKQISGSGSIKVIDLT